MVTFLFTDVEGSTRLWDEHPGAMGAALARHDAILRSVIEAHQGYVFSTAGDAFAAAFWTPAEAVGAAVEAQRRLGAESWPDIAALRVRMGLHTGTADERGGDYFGPAVNRAARLMAAGHGGQIVASSACRDLLTDTGVGLRDLGEHRLKDLAASEHVWQLVGDGLVEQFPPLRTLNVGMHNLPVQRSSFVGREADLVRLDALVGSQRLVTLVGPGGVGKTRLALQGAADLLDRFMHGVWLVELGQLEEGKLVAGAVLDAVGLSRQRRADEVVLAEHLARGTILLVLDNCEHLVIDVAQLVDRLLGRCPTLTVLATSREPLGLDGEHLQRIGCLPRASDGAAAEQLFYDRAQAAGILLADSPEERVRVAEICDRLDGLPLAIELAAARLRAMTLDDLVEHLSHRFRLLVSTRRDAAARHRSLEATVTWSYDQLDASQQHLFDRVGVFAGDFGVAGAAFLVGRDEWEVLDDLTLLVDKSLVNRLDGEAGRARYRLLETLRQLGAEHLRGSAELAETRERLLSWVVTLVREAEPHLTHGVKEWLVRLDEELANIRVALALAVDMPSLAPLGLEVAGRLNRYWFLRTLYGEGRDWVARLLEAAPNAPAVDRARALQTIGFLVGETGEDTAAAVLALDRSVRLYRDLDDRLGLAAALNLRGRVGFAHAAAARADLSESAAIAREVGDAGTLFLDLLLTITWHLTYGAPEDAIPLVDEALTMARQSGGPQGLAHSLEAKAYLSIMGADPSNAGAHLREALVHHREVGNAGCACHALETTALFFATEGRHADASRLAATAAHLRAGLHAPVAPYEAWIGTRLGTALGGAQASKPMITQTTPADIDAALDHAEQLLTNPRPQESAVHD